MCIFQHYGTSGAFRHAILAAIAPLPIIGDPSPTKILALAHYSMDDRITSFLKSNSFNWTNNISEMKGAVGDVTGIHYKIFNAMYLIRVGVGPNYSPRNNSSSFVSEYAIDMTVKGGEFSMLKLMFNPRDEVYEV